MPQTVKRLAGSIRRELGYNIPVVGDYIAKIGQIYAISGIPCSPNPEMWVLAFWHSVPHLLWSLFKPDPLDETFERFGDLHHKKRRGKFGFKSLLQAVDPPATGIGWALFRGAELAQSLGWYMLIVDASLQFDINWMSTAMQWSGCQVPPPFLGQGHASGQGYTNAGLVLNASNAWTADYQNNCAVVFDGASSVTTAQSCNAWFSLETAPADFGFYSPPTMWLEVERLGHDPVKAPCYLQETENGHRYTAAYNSPIFSATRWTAIPKMAQQASGTYKTLNGWLTLSAGGDTGILADP
jgi:hypothetical protein